VPEVNLDSRGQERTREDGTPSGSSLPMIGLRPWGSLLSIAG